ncbi:MAG: hypothetical protein JW981_07115 [Anaerolineae bacterium]|nr:hypothetical protein [Anaerolineae bacterium]
MKHKWFLIILLSSVLWLPSCGVTIPPKAQDGVLNLRHWNFATAGTVGLDGKWEFYWEQLLTPEQFEQSTQPEMTGFIKAPEPWNGYEIAGEPLEGQGYATYRLKVLLPPDLDLLALKIPEFETAYVLYANGEIVGTNGIVGRDKSSMHPKWKPQVTRPIPATPELEIVLQISNFYHKKGGAGQQIRLGTQEQIIQLRERNLNFEFLLFGGLSIMSLYHIGIYSLRSKDRSPLYFGIACFLMALRVLATGEYYITTIYPNLSWVWIVRLNYLAFALTVPFFAMFSHVLFPDEIPAWTLYVLQIAAIVFSGLVIFTPAIIFTYALPPYQVFSILAFIYYIVLIFQAALHHRKSSAIFLSGFLVLFLATTNDILNNNNIIRTGFIGPTGIFIFIFVQAFMLARRFSRAFTQVEILSEELEERVAIRTSELSSSNQQLIQLNAQLQQEILKRQGIEAALIKAKKEAESHALAAQAASKAKSTFLANMSHELRTPLNAILGFAQIMARNPSIPQEEQSNLDTIQRSGEHLLNLINQVLDLSKIDAGKAAFTPTNFDLYHLLDDMENRFKLRVAGKPIEIRFSKDSDVPQYIRTDAVKLRQALTQLLDNAFKFTEEGYIALRVTMQPYISPGTQPTANALIDSQEREAAPQCVLHFEIEDTGPGIAAEEHATLFETFVQTKAGQTLQEGTGLGLPLSRRLIALMKGDFRFNSIVGQGTTFEFDIPVMILNSADIQATQLVYPDITETAVKKTKTFSEEHLIKSLAGMPAEWVMRLEQAALLLDAHQIREVTRQIQETHPDLAQTITQLTEEFKYRKILNFIKESKL